MTCKKAMGVAEEMEKKYGDKLELKTYTTDSEEAKPYKLNQRPIPKGACTYRNCPRFKKNRCLSYPKAMKALIYRRDTYLDFR
jgi:hypothetical protein